MSAVESGREEETVCGYCGRVGIIRRRLLVGDGSSLISARTSPSKHVYDEHGYVPRTSNICFRINCIVALLGIFAPGS
jgi:hypothetical protein